MQVLIVEVESETLHFYQVMFCGRSKDHTLSSKGLEYSVLLL